MQPIHIRGLTVVGDVRRADATVLARRSAATPPVQFSRAARFAGPFVSMASPATLVRTGRPA